MSGTTSRLAQTLSSLPNLLNSSEEERQRQSLLQQLKIRRELWYRRCRTDLRAWCTESLGPVGQTPARHHAVLIRELEAVVRGEVDRLMILMPPGYAKSTYSSVLLPPYWFEQYPRSAIIAASHTGELAEGFGRRVRNTILTSRGVLTYGLSQDNKAAGRWSTTAGGEYLAAGVGGAITGRRADLGLIDDPVKSREEAESETQREKVWSWYRADFYTRLKPGARIVLIMTRWHEDDLSGRLIEEQENGGDIWRVVRMPALCDSPDDPLGRPIGAPLWPEWEDLAALARKRSTMGEREFGALYQQDPRPLGTSFFDVRTTMMDGETQPWPYPRTCDAVFATVDSAVKTGKKHDGTAVIYFGYVRSSKELYVLDWDVTQVEGAFLDQWVPAVYTRLEELARECRARYGSGGVFVEDKASGSILIQQGAKRPDWKMRSIDSALTAMGKDERAISVSGYVTARQVRTTQAAFDKVSVYKGRSANHFLNQVFRFQIGVGDQEDDLLDCWCYGAAITLGNSEGF